MFAGDAQERGAFNFSKFAGASQKSVVRKQQKRGRGLAKAWPEKLEGRGRVKLRRAKCEGEKGGGAIVVSCQMGWNAHGRSHVQKIGSSLNAMGGR